MIMNQKLVENLKGMSREERMAFFTEHKSDFISLSDVSSVNGGAGAEVENPNSEECPYEGNWISSDGYVCNGEVVC